RDQLLVVFSHGSPQKVGQLKGHVSRFVRFRSDQRNDRIKAVKQKMRLQLLPKVVEFSIAQYPFGLVLAPLILFIFFLYVPEDVDDDHAEKKQKVDDKTVGQYFVKMG